MTPLQTLLLVLVLFSMPLALAYFLIVRPLLQRSTQSKTQAEHARTRRLAIVLGMILIASSVFLLIAGGSAISTAARAVNWPKTSGEVIGSEFSRRSMADTMEQYIITIRYQYSVNGTTYTSDYIGWTRRFDVVSFRHQAEERVAQYPPGTPIYVFYNPEDPQQSALDPGTGAGPESIMIGLPLLGAGIYAVWWAVKQRDLLDPAPAKPLSSGNRTGR